MPDADAASMVDFAQCCQELEFAWACIFPTDEERAADEEDDGATCFLADQEDPLAACARMSLEQPRL